MVCAWTKLNSNLIKYWIELKIPCKSPVVVFLNSLCWSKRNTLLGYTSLFSFMGTTRSTHRSKLIHHFKPHLPATCCKPHLQLKLNQRTHQHTKILLQVPSKQKRWGQFVCPRLWKVYKHTTMCFWGLNCSLNVWLTLIHNYTVWKSS